MSAIDALLSDNERFVLQAYRNPRGDFRRATRLSIQYALGMALFVYLVIYDDPLWSLAMYGVFVAWLAIRLIRARAVAAIMPEIIDKYELRIHELQGP